MPSSSARASRKREQLIIHHMPHVRMLAARLHRRCPPSVALEDLISTGVIGLIQAADRYDQHHNVKFQTHAGHRIRGAMLDYLRELDPLPRTTRRFLRDKDCAITQLEQRLNYSPSEQDLAAFMHMPIQRYRRFSYIAQAGMRPTPAPENLDELPATYGPTPYAIALRHRLADAVDSLPARERVVMVSVLAGDTLSEIAMYLGVTPSRVSQLKHRAITRLRIILGATPQAQPNSLIGKTRA